MRFAKFDNLALIHDHNTVKVLENLETMRNVEHCRTVEATQDSRVDDLLRTAIGSVQTSQLSLPSCGNDEVVGGLGGLACS